MTTLQSSDFELFALPLRFAQDRAAIDARWKELQREVHPDKFAAHDAPAQRTAMQWSVRINEAYQRLKDPQRRAAYLCELHGAPIGAHSNTAMPTEFLLQQMAWREALEDAASIDEFDAIGRQAGDYRASALGRIARLTDEEKDFSAAAQEVRALMFVDKLSADVQARIDRAEHEATTATPDQRK